MHCGGTSCAKSNFRVSLPVQAGTKPSLKCEFGTKHEWLEKFGDCWLQLHIKASKLWHLVIFFTVRPRAPDTMLGEVGADPVFGIALCTVLRA